MSTIDALWVEGLSSEILAKFIRQYPHDLHPFFNRQPILDKADYLEGLMEVLRQANEINMRHYKNARPLNLSLYTSDQRQRYKQYVDYYMRLYKIPTLSHLIGFGVKYIPPQWPQPREVNVLFDATRLACLFIYTDALQYSLIPKYAH